MKLLKKLSMAALSAAVVLTLASCNKKAEGEGQYTYKSYSTALGSNWNPHTWETSADDSMLGYISSPFVDMSIKNSETGEYQWVYEMATSVKDVTAENQADLTKYKSTLEAGKTAADITKGYVFEIKLNPNAKWENGEQITADDYVYSMQMLLNSKMRNYRANLYIAGESAIAGALAYYNSEAPIYDPLVSYVDDAPVDNADYATTDKYLNLTSEGMTMASYSFSFMKSYFVTAEEYTALSDQANAYGYIKVTEENYDAVVTICDHYLKAFGMTIYNEDGSVNVDYLKEFFFYQNGFGAKVEYDTVGLYKVDDYTINYVLQTYQDLNYFLTSLTSTWLVYKPLYEAGFDTTGELLTTNYGTSKETTMSYGTYKMESLQDEKQVVYVQNENWYGFTKLEDGSLYSETQFEVDGKKVQQYQTTKIVIDVMTEDAAKQAFLRGELTDWTPSAEELSQYTLSDSLYQVDETYTMSFFFNTNVSALQSMDTNTDNENSVVLSNTNFRKAFSLAINRAEWVTKTAGYKPAFSLLNSLYYYNVYEDPSSVYRNTEEAMKAVCGLYNVSWGEGTKYATLKEAHDAITGYNLTEAKSLMKKACEELVAANLYTAGQNIVIQIGYAKGALTSDDQAQVTLMNNYINAALEGSGFGTVTFVAVGNINDRYGAVPNGDYAIGYGAWGGAAFYPFRNFQVYMDPDQYDINEAACWDPTTEELTLTVNGVEETMTYQAWSNSMMGTGKFASADFETKLAITAQLEEIYLKFYYRIPLATSTSCFMLGYQVSYYTENYNIMYGFGGMRLMKYNYDDAAWAEYVAECGGEVNYA